MPNSLPLAADVCKLPRLSRSFPCDDVVMIDSILSRDLRLPSGGRISIGLCLNSISARLFATDPGLNFERISSANPETNDESRNFVLCFDDAIDMIEPRFAAFGAQGTAMATAGSAC